MSEEIILVLKEVSSQLGIAVDWSSENILPQLQDMAHSLVFYSAISNLFKTLVDVAIIIACLIAIYRFAKKYWKESKEDTFDEDVWFVALVSVIVVCGVLSVVFFVCAIIDFGAFLSWTLMPDIKVAEYILSLV